MRDELQGQTPHFADLNDVLPIAPHRVSAPRSDA